MYANTLREQLSKLSTDMNAIVNKAQFEKHRGLTNEEATTFDNLAAAYSKIENDITRTEKAQPITADLRKHSHSEIVDAYHVTSEHQAARNHDEHSRAFASYMRGGEVSLTAGQRQVLNTFVTRDGSFRNTMSTTTGSQGGYTVPQGFSDQLETAMKWFGGSEAFSEFNTDTGNTLPWPTENDTSNTGRILGQNTQLANTDISNFGQINFSAFIFTSDAVVLPLALIQDSAFDLEKYIAYQLGTRLGRIKNLKMTKGAGTTEPNGIITSALAAGALYTLPTGSSASVTFDNLTDLEHKVDISYRDEAKYMFHDTTFQYIKKLKDGNNRPIWIPLAEAGHASAMPGTINGHLFTVNNDMDALGASNHPVLFGDLSKYKVRKVAGDTTLMVLRERYADYLQVGYQAFTRMDGQLVDAGTHPVMLLANSAT